MNKIKISVTSKSVTVNGHTWSVAPSIEELCRALGAHDLTDGSDVIVDKKPSSKFRYFDEFGIGILESIPGAKVTRITVFMHAPPPKRKPISPYGNTGQRRTATEFLGLLELNGRQLKSPVKFTQFPVKGDLLFINRMAWGSAVEASVAVDSGFVEHVSLFLKDVNNCQ